MRVRPAKTQISLGIRPVWSESSLSAWKTLATHWAHSEDSDQTGLMPRLIWVFAWRTVILLVLSCCGSFVLIQHERRGHSNPQPLDLWSNPLPMALQSWMLTQCRYLSTNLQESTWIVVMDQSVSDNDFHCGSQLIFNGEGKVEAACSSRFSVPS